MSFARPPNAPTQTATLVPELISSVTFSSVMFSNRAPSSEPKRPKDFSGAVAAAMPPTRFEALTVRFRIAYPADTNSPVNTAGLPSASFKPVQSTPDMSMSLARIYFPEKSVILESASAPLMRV